MAEEIREKCLKIIADSCELDIKELCRKYAEQPLYRNGCIYTCAGVLCKYTA